jgi:hypothetical protein
VLSGAWGCRSKKDTPSPRARRETDRRLWREEVRELWPPRRLVFVDECGTHTSMTRRYARAPKGERAYGSVPPNRGPNTTLFWRVCRSWGWAGRWGGGGGDHEGRLRGLRRAGPGTATLIPGQVVILDNLTAHKSKRVLELVEGRGCRVLFLPAYSPDLSPIVRRRFLQGQSAAQEGCAQDPQGARRRHRAGTFGDHRARRRGLVRPLWLLARRSNIMRTAVEGV